MKENTMKWFAMSLLVQCMMLGLAEVVHPAATEQPPAERDAEESSRRELLRKQVSLRDSDWALILYTERRTFALQIDGREVEQQYELLKLVKEPLPDKASDARQRTLVWWTVIPSMPSVPRWWRFDVETDNDKMGYLAWSAGQAIAIDVIDLSASAPPIEVYVGMARPVRLRPPSPNDALSKWIRQLRIRKSGDDLVVSLRYNSSTQDFTYSLASREWRVGAEVPDLRRDGQQGCK